MQINIVPRDDKYTLAFLRSSLVYTQVFGLTEHDLNDLEFVLAQRKAGSKRCEATSGEHTCGYAPEHGLVSHHCRACLEQWSG